MKGQKMMLVKGDRGVNIGIYALVLTFVSIEDRGRIYPALGGMEGDWGDDAVWVKLRTRVEGIGTTFTEYEK